MIKEHLRIILHAKMLNDDELFPPHPFSFASTELLTEVLRAEIDALTELLAKNPDVRNFLDSPEATLPQRTVCFVLLAHRKLIDAIDDTLTARYEQLSLSPEKLQTLKRTYNLVVADAPAWALEINQLVERLPAYIYTALPEALRQGGFNPENPEQMKAIESAKETLSNIGQIQALTERVIGQQLQRLAGRWSTAISAVSQPQPVLQSRTITTTTSGEHARRVNKRKGWEQKLKLYSAIQKALDRNASLQGLEFCAELDKRHAPPLYDWVKTGEWREGLTWKEAWASRRLRKKIRRVRQEAIKRR
jgi:hypothetical protein